MQNCPPHPLMTAIRSFDYTLQKPVLARMNLEKMATALAELAEFHDVVEDFSPPADPYLASVGCRLSTDLTEALMIRLADQLQEQDAAIEQLSSQLKALLARRHQTARLLNQAQDIRRRNVEAGECLGLGLLL